MKLPPRVLAMMRENPDYLPLEPLHGWRSAPDDNGYTRCWACQHPMYLGDPCVAKYLRYIRADCTYS